jgi:uncharacterized membrane protein
LAELHHPQEVYTPGFQTHCSTTYTMMMMVMVMMMVMMMIIHNYILVISAAKLKI